MNKKRGAALVLSACMVLSLAACGGSDCSETASELKEHVAAENADNYRPETASELMEHVAAVENADNYRVEGSVVMDMAVESEGVSMAMPVEMTFSGAVMGTDSYVHADTSTSIFGMSTTVATDTYFVDGVTYTGTSEDGGEMVWAEPVESSEANDFGFIENLTDQSFFANAEMSYEDGVYTVTVPVADVEGFASMFDELDMTSEESGTSAMADMFADTVLTYKVDDGFYLQSVTMSDISYSEEDTDLGTLIEVNMGMSFTMSGYGEVTADDVAVPADAQA